MISTTPPTKIQLPFANGGTKNTIPVASQIGTTPGRASFTDGFPPLTTTPLAAGGVPPYGADFNGILNSITDLQRWQSAGGYFTYDAAFSTAVGGYPKGAQLLNSTATALWLNTVDGNTTNPDTGGAGWLIQDPASKSRDFASLQAISGYQKLPNGNIRQWGSVSILGTAISAIVNLQIAYPTAVLNCRANDSGATCFIGAASSISNSQIQVFINPYTSNTGSLVAKNGPALMFWETIGN